MTGLLWAFLAPMIVLILLDPIVMIPTMLFCTVWIAVWLWILNNVLGKKDQPPQ